MSGCQRSTISTQRELSPSLPAWVTPWGKASLNNKHSPSFHFLCFPDTVRVHSSTVINPTKFKAWLSVYYRVSVHAYASMCTCIYCPWSTKRRFVKKNIFLYLCFVKFLKIYSTLIKFNQSCWLYINIT